MNIIRLVLQKVLSQFPGSYINCQNFCGPDNLGGVFGLFCSVCLHQERVLATHFGQSLKLIFSDIPS